MGMWGTGIWDDDLALDIKATFEEAVANGASQHDAAAGLMKSELAVEILEEFSEEERDEEFWEESGGLFFAVAALQLEHGALTAEVKRQTLAAIEAWREIGAGDEPRLATLEQLRSQLLASK